MPRARPVSYTHLDVYKRQGYSMVQLIETSLISGHFANDTNSAYLDIFSCKGYEPAVVEEFSKAFFGARRSSHRAMLRY